MVGSICDRLRTQTVEDSSGLSSFSLLFFSSATPCVSLWCEFKQQPELQTACLEICPPKWWSALYPVVLTVGQAVTRSVFKKTTALSPWFPSTKSATLWTGCAGGRPSAVYVLERTVWVFIAYFIWLQSLGICSKQDWNILLKWLSQSLGMSVCRRVVCVPCAVVHL